ncbi:DUF192 domain-containing protein [Blattabacterium cuenoti]|uniref:DUF192 domain-containing protein n=1 Tax=Blattabacterium cuenoti TaxID=1653831 RepID=UPI00163C0051|nr:DUF192 domain-containing protein [Blattabacterium cuenoti]
MKKINIFFSLMIISFFFLISEERINYDYDLEDIGNLLEIEFIKNGELYFKNKNSIIKKIDIELAYRDIEKTNGLKFRSSLKENRGMLFLLKNQEEYKKINMKNMRIPLDIVYINQLNTVIFIKKNISPMREIEVIDFSVPDTIKYILEIHAGMSNKWGIKEGITKITWFFSGKNGN